MKKQECIICASEDTFKKFDNLTGYERGTFFDIYECKKCKSRFIKKEDIDYGIYNKIYKDSDKIPGYDRYEYYFNNIIKQKNKLGRLCKIENTPLIIKQYLENINKKNLKILEIGCGLGYTTYALNEAGYDCTGIDISEESIKKAKKQFGDFYIKGNANELVKQKKYKGKYDLIFSTEVVEHIHDVSKFLDTIRLFIKGEGAIIITTPNKDFIGNNYVWRGDKPTVHTSYISETFFRNYSQERNLNMMTFDYIKYIKTKNILYHLLIQKIFLFFGHKKYYKNYQIDFKENSNINNNKVIKIVNKFINNYFFNKISFFILNYIIKLRYSGLGIILKGKGDFS